MYGKDAKCAPTHGSTTEQPQFSQSSDTVDSFWPCRDPQSVAMADSTRRSFLRSTPLWFVPGIASARSQTSPTPGATFPTQEAEVIREVVGVSHGNITRLKELVDRRPALSRAAWDWGFGDWESALGAASHVGNREIAVYLLERGARPTIFSAAMLGQLAVVRAFIEAQPGLQRTKGPHGITLLAHATAGGAAATPVVEYLKTVGDADRRLENQPLSATDRDRLVGQYTFGPQPSDRLDVAVAPNGVNLNVVRPGGTPRGLIHRGNLEFSPVGADDVRLRFTASDSDVTLTVLDPDVVLVAHRRSGDRVKESSHRVIG
jgi:hypothetical protein